MVSRNQKIAVVTIAAIILLASVAFILTNEPAEPTPAEQMILLPSDIGLGWGASSTLQWPMDQVNESSICLADLGNSTIDLDLRIDVFNSTNDSHNAFHRWLSDLPPIPFENISLGDEAVYFPQGTSIPGVIFVRGYVTAWVQTQAFPGYIWQKNATIDIASLQLQKIDQYLAQHPGAS
jgi:hypothetical protein